MRSPNPQKLLLVADDRMAPKPSAAVPLRRYRLARLSFEAEAPEGASRFEYLKRVYE